MCLYLNDKNPKLKVATKNIPVFKVVKKSFSPRFVESFYNRFVYEKGELKYSIISMNRIVLGQEGKFWFINQALHSYSYKVPIAFTKAIDSFFIGGGDHNHHSYSIIHRPILGAFIIPVGSEYYMQDNMYASDQLIYTGYNQPVFDNIDINKFIDRCKS